MKRRLTALLCAAGLVCCLALATEEGSVQPPEEQAETTAAAEAAVPAEASAQPQGYPDVVGDEWFAGAVEEMTRRGIMTGVEDGLFAPYAPVTRATVITVLWRMVGAPTPSGEENFPDAVGDWFEVPAAWGKQTGIATGYDDGSFGGRDPVTREQLACFLYRYAYQMGQPLGDGALGLFSDVSDVSPWAETAIRHTVGVGILQGGDGGRIDPQGVANRAALAVMLQRMLTPAMG